MFLVIDCKIHSHDTKIKLAKMGNEAFGAWVLLAAYVRLNGTYDGQLEYGSLSNLFSILNINSYRKLKIILDQLCKSNWIQIDYQNCHIKIPKWLKYQRIFNLKALKAAAILEGKNAEPPPDPQTPPPLPLPPHTPPSLTLPPGEKREKRELEREDSSSSLFRDSEESLSRESEPKSENKKHKKKEDIIEADRFFEFLKIYPPYPSERKRFPLLKVEWNDLMKERVSSVEILRGVEIFKERRLREIKRKGRDEINYTKSPLSFLKERAWIDILTTADPEKTVKTGIEEWHEAEVEKSEEGRIENAKRIIP